MESDDSRNAMRSFLQRAEVRLSTMHRVAGVFLNGAGLLILLPIFLKDTFLEMNKKLLVFNNHPILELISSLLVSISVILSLLVLILALYYLIKDLVLFYFVGHTIGYKKLFNPRFGLSPISFSHDESEEAKQKIKETEYNKDFRAFVIPPYEKESEYFDSLYEAHHDKIIPGTRLSDLNSENQQFLVALGLAGFYDRTLVEEVAKMEISLVRHNIGLRRLVLRYIKALLLFIWSAIITFLAVSFLNVSVVNSIAVVSISYLLWGLLAQVIVKLPVKWIYELASQNQKLEQVQKDPALVQFEKQVEKICNISIVFTVLSLGALIVNYFFHLG
jgi:hypothetical protein